MDAPPTCPYGHPMGPRRVLVGWLPCRCPTARQGGHQTRRCRTCMDLPDHRQTIHHDPPCTAKLERANVADEEGPRP